MASGSNDRVLELKKLIEESKERLRIKNLSLENINKALLLKRKEIAEAEANLLKFKSSKIFTKKELRSIKRAKAEKEKREFNALKLNINKETKKAFEEAKQIRRNAMGGSKKEIKDAENLAFEMEKKALSRELYVLNCILDEKNQIYQDALSEKICHENNLKKLKSSLDSSSKIETNSLKSKVKNLADQCWNLKKELQDLNYKIEKSYFRLSQTLSSQKQFN